MEEELPYRAEYAKSGRAGCKGCKTNIPKDTLRLAVMVQAFNFDGKTPNWYHFPCFFGKQRPKSIGDIAHIDSLRWDDQEKIKKKIEELAAGGGVANGASTSNGKGKATKRGAGAAAGALKDFVVEYAKSSRAMCKGCEEKIMKGEVRISKKDYESEVGKRYGGQDCWHHIECFVKLRDELEFFAPGTELPGFKTLSKEDQQSVKEKLPQTASKVKDEVDGPAPAKKIKSEPGDPKEDEEMKKQNKIMFKYRDSLKQQLKKKDMIELLEYNKQLVPSGEEKILDRLADLMTFGKLLPCKECNGGQFVFRSGVGYQCIGDLTEWTKCQNKTLDPPRAPFKIPKSLKEEYDFLNNYKYKERKRVIKITAPSSIPSSVNAQLPNYPVKSEPGLEGKSQPKVYRPPAPLKNIEIVILGKTETDKEELKQQIVKLGGKVSSKIHSMVFAVISNKDEIERMGSRMEQVKDLDIHVVSEDFVDEVKDGETPLSVIKKKAISSWGGDPKERIPEVKETQKSKMTSGGMFKSKSGTVKLQLKGGIAVDPDSNLDDRAHVYKDGKNVYNAALCLTDIQSGKNSYYKLQVLEADKGNRYWVFRSWGRIGTTIGGNKVEEMSTLFKAKELFESLYEEKSGNNWHNRDHFVKVPGRMFPMEVDYGDDKAKGIGEVAADVKSKLPPPVQDLIKTIFDVETMKKSMMEFELDLEKMPLGKLSKRQLLEAYSILKKLEELIQKESKEDVKSVNSYAKYVDYSNRFFTLVPHDFGINTPPVLNTEEIIKQKMEVIDNLLEIEIAYNLLDSESSEENKHPIDNHYEKLKADIEPLARDSEEYKMLEQYVKNTHAETHTQYKLAIEEVFVVHRHGEDRKFKPFKKIPNHKLLWHGSRLTNYAGILSQGLRIAPPEAPVTGYMFGKGVYFADMVSKSANYCMTSRMNPTGYMLLCQVALGDMYECTKAEYIEKLPKGKHSCKGIGKTEPDPAASIKTPDGVEIPLGTGVTDAAKKSSLLYNEYIVYDTAQIKFQYLFKMKFDYQM